MGAIVEMRSGSTSSRRCVTYDHVRCRVPFIMFTPFCFYSIRAAGGIQRCQGVIAHTSASLRLLARGWTLVGGLMVQAHAIVHGIAAVGPTDDLDLLHQFVIPAGHGRLV